MEKEIEMFLKMGAAYNSGSSTLDGMDVDDAPFSAGDVVKTHQAAADFGCSPSKKIPDLQMKSNHQIKAGARRGDLFVADFGDFRLVAFTGEGALKDE